MVVGIEPKNIRVSGRFTQFLSSTDFILKFGQNLKKGFNPAFKSAPQPPLLKAIIPLRAKPDFRRFQVFPRANARSAHSCGLAANYFCY
jgi:hypothetical protein